MEKGVSQAVQKAELAELKDRMVGEVSKGNESKVVQTRRTANETVTV